MITIKHPETGEELEFKSKKEILEYFELKCSYRFFTKKTREIGTQETVDYLYSKLIRIKHPDTGEDLVFKSQNDLLKYFKLNCDLSSLNIRIRDNGAQEAINHYYFKKLKTIKVKHPETGKELEFTTKRGIVDYFDLKLPYNSFNVKCNKIGIQEALNYYYYLSDNETKFIKVKHPDTGEDLEFKSKKAVYDYFVLSKKTDINYFYQKIKSIGVQKALEYYLTNKNIKVTHPETREELEFENLKKVWEYFDIGYSYSRFWDMVNKFGINEAIKKVKLKKTLKFRDLEFKNYEKLKKYFELGYFDSNTINKYNYLTIEEIVIIFKLKQGYVFIDNSYDDFYFQEIGDFVKEKGLSEEYVKQKLNEGFTSKDFK